jgi:NhaP-type Na+/H+ or K+/H+ antiporter
MQIRLFSYRNCGNFFLLRFIQLKVSKNPYFLFFCAPRGLITILLFLGIAPEQRIFLVNKSLIIQVILMTAIIMMLGLMITAKKKNNYRERRKAKEAILNEKYKTACEMPK